MLDANLSEEYYKIFELLSFEAYSSEGSKKNRGIFMKQVFYLANLYTEALVRNNKLEQLTRWMEKLSRISRYYVIINENIKDKNISISMQNSIIANDLYVLTGLYQQYQLAGRTEIKNLIKKNLFNSEIIDPVTKMRMIECMVGSKVPQSI